MDTMTKQKRSWLMSRIKSQHTKPELVFQHLLDSINVEYKTHWKELPGNPDFVIPAIRVAVQVHGCFFHGCPQHYKEPLSNVTFWANKIQRNRERDRRTEWRLRKRGWRVWHFWEHDLTTPERAERAGRRLNGLLARIYSLYGFKLAYACHVSPGGVMHHA